MRWLIVLAPIGVFALILPITARTGASTVGAFAYYIAAISGLLCVLTLALYPIAAMIGRVSAKRFAEAAFSAQAIAFSSRSSLASSSWRLKKTWVPHSYCLMSWPAEPTLRLSVS